MSALLSLRHVSLNLGGVQALQDISLEVFSGEQVAFIGANGSGKSTMLRLLNGLHPPTEGTLDLPRCRQAMLFQRPHMLRTSSLNNVAVGLWLDRSLQLGWAACKQRAQEALSVVGLAGVTQQNAATLSGGQQQRLALARAWAREPQLLFLDEPTASLDPPAKREVEALMAEFACAPERPLTLVWASHNLGQVKRLATRVIYLEFGQVLADLPVADFFNPVLLAERSPAAHAFVQGELS